MLVSFGLATCAFAVVPGAAWTGQSNQLGSSYGYAVASAGDVDGDGFADVVIGVPWYSAGQVYEGATALYRGSAAGLALSPAWAGQANQDDARFGASVSSAGDVNGDGYDDVIVGAYLYDGGQTDEGIARLYLGSPAGLPAAPSWSFGDGQASSTLGRSVAGAGDVNGDGYDDVVVGADLFDNGQADEGRVFVFHGGPAGLAVAPSWTSEPDIAGTRWGQVVGPAGDVNGDGYDDVAVQSQLGVSVFLGAAAGLQAMPGWTRQGNPAGYGTMAAAGDVNADGFDDLVVGAYTYSNGEANEGGAFLYLGSALGLGASPAWTAESNQATATFGRAVTGAGDLNGDGFDDVAVAADQYDNVESDEGRIFVYLGWSGGLRAGAAATVESNQNTAYFGAALSSAGDVDGDGRADLIVGSKAYDQGQTDEGAAFLFLGR